MKILEFAVKISTALASSSMRDVSRDAAKLRADLENASKSFFSDSDRRRVQSTFNSIGATVNAGLRDSYTKMSEASKAIEATYTKMALRIGSAKDNTRDLANYQKLYQTNLQDTLNIYGRLNSAQQGQTIGIIQSTLEIERQNQALTQSVKTATTLTDKMQALQGIANGASNLVNGGAVGAVTRGVMSSWEADRTINAQIGPAGLKNLYASASAANAGHTFSGGVSQNLVTQLGGDLFGNRGGRAGMEAGLVPAAFAVSSKLVDENQALEILKAAADAGAKTQSDFEQVFAQISAGKTLGGTGSDIGTALTSSLKQNREFAPGLKSTLGMAKLSSAAAGAGGREFAGGLMDLLSRAAKGDAQAGGAAAQVFGVQSVELSDMFKSGDFSKLRITDDIASRLQSGGSAAVYSGYLKSVGIEGGDFALRKDAFNSKIQQASGQNIDPAQALDQLRDGVVNARSAVDNFTTSLLSFVSSSATARDTLYNFSKVGGIASDVIGSVANGLMLYGGLKGLGALGGSAGAAGAAGSAGLIAMLGSAAMIAAVAAAATTAGILIYKDILAGADALVATQDLADSDKGVKLSENRKMGSDHQLAEALRKSNPQLSVLSDEQVISTNKAHLANTGSELPYDHKTKMTPAQQAAYGASIRAGEDAKAAALIISSFASYGGMHGL